MNLDELISKYLDSDLTFEEDQLLRGYVTSNQESKEIFDASVSLHYAIREDAESIQAPQDVLKETEDKILMMILNEPPVIMPAIKSTQRIPSLALMSAALLFLLVMQINEPHFRYASIQDNLELTFASDYDDYTQGSINEFAGSSLNFNSPTEIISSMPVMRNTSRTHTSGARITSQEISNDYFADLHLLPVNDGSTDLLPESLDELLSSIESGIIRTIAFEPTNIQPATDENINIISSAKSSDNYVVLSDHNTNKINESGKYRMSASSVSTRYGAGEFGSFPILNTIDEFTSSSEVQLTTLFGTDFFRGGLNLSNEQPISHIAQSVAYSIDDVNRVGIEFGYTQYAYKDNFDIKVPIGQSLIGGNISQHSSIEVKDLEPGQYDYVSYSVEFERTKQLFWGAVFFETTIYNESGFSLNSRAGLGSSGEGMLGYGRIFVKYELLPGFYATAGIDGRLFYTMLQRLSQNTAGVKSSASFIYGLQLKF